MSTYLEAMFEDLADSMGLLHAKMETLIMNQALGEGQDGAADGDSQP
jgi:hypothetical protein